MLLVSFQLGLKKEGSAIVIFYEHWAIIKLCGQIPFCLLFIIRLLFYCSNNVHLKPVLKLGNLCCKQKYIS